MCWWAGAHPYFLLVHWVHNCVENLYFWVGSVGHTLPSRGTSVYAITARFQPRWLHRVGTVYGLHNTSAPDVRDWSYSSCTVSSSALDGPRPEVGPVGGCWLTTSPSRVTLCFTNDALVTVMTILLTCFELTAAPVNKRRYKHQALWRKLHYQKLRLN
jgi:hypothetical protein